LGNETGRLEAERLALAQAKDALQLERDKLTLERDALQADKAP
jgi:hypothetical protein